MFPVAGPYLCHILLFPSFSYLVNKMKKIEGKPFPFRYIFCSLLECLELANTSHRRRSKCELKGTASTPRHTVVSLHLPPLLEGPDSLASQRAQAQQRGRELNRNSHHV